ncbi:hypothetical protein A45J_0971 [hot springs metagenome]|uniref:Uncharacterized protein n=1 Tax=hot springs metagenome TaxID=433727 RepID=A0A5J4KZ45_9ZZZZ
MKKVTKNKKSSIAETIAPYTTDSFSFEDMIDTIVHGDNLTVLRLIPDNSINLIITNLPISVIIDYLKQHFESRYSSRGASRLPTLSIYSIYQCMIKELKRFEGKVPMPLEEHTSSDKRSGRVGDVEVRDSDGRVLEAKVE